MAFRSIIRRFPLHNLLRTKPKTCGQSDGFLHIAIGARFIRKTSVDIGMSKSPFYKHWVFVSGGALTASLLTYSLLKESHPWTPSVQAAQIDAPRQQFNFIADVVEKVAPAVVHIEIMRGHSGYVMNINGSGFIVRDDGLILTNAHVVANQQRVRIKLHDGREFEGSVMAVDPVSDLATIKINAKNLPTIRLGKSSSIRPGEWVIAMGSPLSLSNTVTAGIVSTVHRDSRELGLHNRDMEYIQVDAVINQGNSGGPLVNLDGEAIGINTMKITAGISFAIPSDYASVFLGKADEFMKKVQSKSSGKVGKMHGYIGISMLTLSPRILMELQQWMTDFPDVREGVLVQSVFRGSPAHMGGLHPGDVVIQINGKSVKNASEVQSAINSSNVLQMDVMRGQRRLQLKITPQQIN